MIVFDLGGTLKDGEVDCGRGHPLARIQDSRHALRCRIRRTVTLANDVPMIFDALADNGVTIAYASRTWEPKWAEEALNSLTCGVRRDKNIWSVASADAWGDCSKNLHLKTVASKLSVDFASLVLFGNESRDINAVPRLKSFGGTDRIALLWMCSSILWRSTVTTIKNITS